MVACVDLESWGHLFRWNWAEVVATCLHLIGWAEQPIILFHFDGFRNDCLLLLLNLDRRRSAVIHSALPLFEPKLGWLNNLGLVCVVYHTVLNHRYRQIIHRILERRRLDVPHMLMCLISLCVLVRLLVACHCVVPSLFKLRNIGILVSFSVLFVLHEVEVVELVKMGTPVVSLGVKNWVLLALDLNLTFWRRIHAKKVVGGVILISALLLVQGQRVYFKLYAIAEWWLLYLSQIVVDETQRLNCKLSQLHSLDLASFVLFDNGFLYSILIEVVFSDFQFQVFELLMNCQSRCPSAINLYKVIFATWTHIIWFGAGCLTVELRFLRILKQRQPSVNQLWQVQCPFLKLNWRLWILLFLYVLKKWWALFG